MPRISEHPLIKVTMRLRRDDVATIKDIARTKGVSENLIFREVIHSYAIQSEALVRKTIDKLPPAPAFSIEELTDAQ